MAITPKAVIALKHPALIGLYKILAVRERFERNKLYLPSCPKVIASLTSVMKTEIFDLGRILI